MCRLSRCQCHVLKFGFTLSLSLQLGNVTYADDDEAAEAAAGDARIAQAQMLAAQNRRQASLQQQQQQQQQPKQSRVLSRAHLYSASDDE